MLELPLVQTSMTVRSGSAQWIAEVIAAFGLLEVILAAVRLRPVSVHWLVGLYITAAYCFTASTSFANPAVAIARAFSDTFAGIRPMDVPAFLGAEFFGCRIGSRRLRVASEGRLDRFVRQPPSLQQRLNPRHPATERQV